MYHCQYRTTVASTALVEHTKSSEHRGRHGGTYKYKGGGMKKKCLTNNNVEKRSSIEQRIPMQIIFSTFIIRYPFVVYLEDFQY